MARINLGNVRGKSAYEIWLGEGNQGSKQDFLNSLKGQKGDQGIAGPQGPKGENSVGEATDSFFQKYFEINGVLKQGESYNYDELIARANLLKIHLSDYAFERSVLSVINLIDEIVLSFLLKHKDLSFFLEWSKLLQELNTIYLYIKSSTGEKGRFEFVLCMDKVIRFVVEYVLVSIYPGSSEYMKGVYLDKTKITSVDVRFSPGLIFSTSRNNYSSFLSGFSLYIEPLESILKGIKENG